MLNRRCCTSEFEHQVEVVEQPVHASYSSIDSTPCVRPSESTSTTPCSVRFSRSARLPFSTPMKLATNSVAGASVISLGLPTCAICAPFSRITHLIAQQERLVDVVGHEHDGLVELALQADQLRLQLGPHDRVDRRRRARPSAGCWGQRPTRAPHPRAAAGRRRAGSGTGRPARGKVRPDVEQLEGLARAPRAAEHH